RRTLPIRGAALQDGASLSGCRRELSLEFKGNRLAQNSRNTRVPPYRTKTLLPLGCRHRLRSRGLRCVTASAVLDGPKLKAKVTGESRRQAKHSPARNESELAPLYRGHAGALMGTPAGRQAFPCVTAGVSVAMQRKLGASSSYDYTSESSRHAKIFASWE